MRLWLRITIMVSILLIFTVTIISFFVTRQIKTSLNDVNYEFGETLGQSVSQAILDYTIEGNARQTRDILRRIIKKSHEIEYIVVVDFNNRLFASSLDFLAMPDILKKIDHSVCVAKAAIADKNFHSSKTLTDDLVFNYKARKIYDFTYPFIKNLNAHMHIGFRKTSLNNTLASVEKYTVIIAAIVIITGFLVSYLIGKRISRPIEKLSKEVSEFGKTGKYKQKDIKTTDKDILELINSFENMFKERTFYEAEISAYRDNLEKQVQERTRSLVQEIEEHKITERKLHQEKIISEKASNAKSDFLSRMSHELRTPLNAILGFSQLLELEEDATVREYTSEILKAGNHLLSLVNDILDLSKIEAGKLVMSVEEVNWNTVIAESIALLREDIDEKNINISLKFDETRLFMVRVDRVRLKQICINLLSNAVKYNEQSGSVIIFFELHDNNIRMCIKDTGQGIQENKQEKLFTPFERLDIDQNVVDGVGVGLVITKALVERMQGEIGFKSEFGIGSVFWVEFPLERIEEKSPEPVNRKILPDSKHEVLPFEGIKKILYIEDNPSNLKVVENIFKPYSNIELYTASKPSLGLDMLKHVIPDLILLDINLPEMDGYAVKKILENSDEYRDIKVVAVSANAMQHDVDRATKSGFVDYISKPIEVNDFISTVTRLLAAE